MCRKNQVRKSEPMNVQRKWMRIFIPQGNEWSVGLEWNLPLGLILKLPFRRSGVSTLAATINSASVYYGITTAARQDIALLCGGGSPSGSFMGLGCCSIQWLRPFRTSVCKTIMLSSLPRTNYASAFRNTCVTDFLPLHEGNFSHL